MKTTLQVGGSRALPQLIVLDLGHNGIGDDGLAALREDVEGLLRRRHDHVHDAHDHVARQERDGAGHDRAN